MTRFAWGLASDTGLVRESNQDDALAIEGLFAVADGMGGHRGGEVASSLAVGLLREAAPILTTPDLLEAIHEANQAILVAAEEDPELRGMGTTLCVLALVEADGEERLAIANVGDSRVYLFAQGELEQMTEDHSLVAALVREGQLSPEEAEDHPQRNILTRALGIDRRLVIDAWEVHPYAGDRWVLCSDGLFNEVTEAQIGAVLRRLADPAEAASELVRLANEGGGRDNVTVLVVDIVEREGHAVIAEQPDRQGAERHAGRSAGAVEPDAGGPREEGGAAGLDVGSRDPGEDAGDEGGGAGEDAGAVVGGGPAAGRRHRIVRSPALPRPTWRTGLFVGAVVVLAAIAFGGIAYHARSSWYVDLGEDGATAVIYQGRPGGVLWFQPTRVEEVRVGALTPEQAEQLTARRSHSSLDAARRFIERWTEPRVAATPTTSPPATPTTSPPPTTAPAGGGAG